METGTVKFFNVTKGFGFIKPATPGEDLFVHTSGLADASRGIKENDKVSFDVQRGAKGLNAINVKVI
jgi:CspA family cold shock protein